jgi:hypothetical protein
LSARGVPGGAWSELREPRPAGYRAEFYGVQSVTRLRHLPVVARCHRANDQDLRVAPRSRAVGSVPGGFRCAASRRPLPLGSLSNRHGSDSAGGTPATRGGFDGNLRGLRSCPRATAPGRTGAGSFFAPGMGPNPGWSSVAGHFRASRRTAPAAPPQPAVPPSSAH